MRKFPAIAALIFIAAIFPSIAPAQQEAPSWEMWALNQIIPGAPVGTLDIVGDMATGTNGICVKYGGTVLMADSISVDRQSGEAVADGHVRIEQEGGQIWIGEHIAYNFKTRMMRSDQFRTGKAPIFAAGMGLGGDTSNRIYTASNIFITTDDVSDPAIRIHASHVRIVPDKYIEAWNAVVFVDGVPVLYFPYLKRNIGPHANNWNFFAGYRSAYGAFLLTDYTWWLNDTVDGKFHLDYRTDRGPGIGPDFNLHLGQWGDATFKYYYLHDNNPYASTNGLPIPGPIPENRQRVYLGWQATPFTNLNVKALVNYQSDPFVLHDFFEGEYTKNPQPPTFTEINKYSENWSLDAEASPELNNFFDQVERLPDVKLTGLRQQIFDTPVYYESESSAGYYRKFFADTNGPAANTNNNYSATRVDTYHQLILPWTFFGWLNVAPRVGGRFTYYGTESGPGGTNAVANRTVFNTGVEVSFKASQLWANATNSFLQISGLRHIIEPSVNYVFVPNPSVPFTQLPQFDSELPSPLLLPIQFPDYNDIDSIDSQNVIRFGVRNTLQTKRDGQLDNLIDWNVLMDWRIVPNSTQQTFSDIYNDLTFRPRTWITFASQTRFDVNNAGRLNLASHQLTLTPNEKWSWGLGHYYSRPGFVDGGDDFVTSTIFYKLNENWGFRAVHYFNAQTGHLQEQFYTVYRDLRSWTGALTFRVVDNGGGQPEDYTVAFTISLKAAPHHVGDDTVQPYGLVGE
jgi:lipopolysaccharide assembly outer membrane protein LptD (OstA)